MSRLLHSGFLAQAASSPERIALLAEGVELTYGQLSTRAARIAATLQMRTPPGGEATVGVFADRSRAGFSGILASLLAGRAYVPLNPSFPASKTLQMFHRAGTRALIVDASGEPQIDGLLDGAPPTLVVLPHRGDTTAIAARWPQHTVVGDLHLEPETAWSPPPTRPEDGAYLLFTSGSTGTPKGVLVTHANAVHFVQSAVARYGITADDRFSQTFDATFDLSVFDLFVAWSAGARVCCPPRATLWNPSRFINEQKLTVWFSVPSLALLMNRIGALKPSSHPSLRWSLFCGERLPMETVTAWLTAAPSSTVENLYGPTELTIACTAYRWDRQRSPAACEGGGVPIGEPLPGMRALVVNDQLNEVLPGDTGELLMSGPQRTPGYWQDAEATARSFVTVSGYADLFYRTGDRVRRPVDDTPMTFLGRVDQQIKVRGHRVELGEVESRLMEIPGVESAAAVGWPTNAAGAQGVVAFVTGRDLEPASLRGRLQTQLQDYAVPQTIRVVPDLPLNANGKVDRPALVALLEHR
jgi:amino acid adenylation domain-containing protein